MIVFKIFSAITKAFPRTHVNVRLLAETAAGPIRFSFRSTDFAANLTKSLRKKFVRVQTFCFDTGWTGNFHLPLSFWTCASVFGTLPTAPLRSSSFFLNKPNTLRNNPFTNAPHKRTELDHANISHQSEDIEDKTNAALEAHHLFFRIQIQKRPLYESLARSGHGLRWFTQTEDREARRRFTRGKHIEFRTSVLFLLDWR
jgi:hypothetical protein